MSRKFTAHYAKHTEPLKALIAALQSIVERTQIVTGGQTAHPEAC